MALSLNKQIELVVAKVNAFLRNKEKAKQWVATPNPLFGNVSPLSMILLGRLQKVLKVIEETLEENQAPKRKATKRGKK